MASEIAITTSVSVTKSDIAETLSSTSTETMTDTAFCKESQLIPTSATAINLGSLATLGRYEILNTDPTNFVDLLTNTTGITFNHILPNSSVNGYFHSTITAPAARANVGSVRIKYLILPV